MTSMKALPAHTVRLIGSSQVITSVVSAVKELIENSLDARCTSIDIKLDDYGFSKVEVRDNGSGIAPCDTEFMAQPHYTSKINDHADLDKLHTYGFRGEALGSLCAVSDVNITTMSPGDPLSQVYKMDYHGRIIDSKPSHLGQGTTVTAVNLFKNLPVRKQYYSTTKRKKDELKKIEDLIISFAVIWPEVRMSLRHNKELIWQKSVVSDHRSVLVSVLSAGVVNKLDHIRKSLHDLQVQLEAFLPKLNAETHSVTRTTNDRCYVSINKRPVNMKQLDKVLRQSYIETSGCDSSRWPVAFLSVTLQPSNLDVNVDPNKTKVMLHDMDDLLAELKKWLHEHYAKQKRDLNPVKTAETKPSDTNNSVGDAMNFDLDFQLLSQNATSTQCGKDKNRIVGPNEDSDIEIDCGTSVTKSFTKSHEVLADKPDNIVKSENIVESCINNHENLEQTLGESYISGNNQRRIETVSRPNVELDESELGNIDLTVPQPNQIFTEEHMPMIDQTKDCSAIENSSFDGVGDISDDVIASLDFTTPEGKSGDNEFTREASIEEGESHLKDYENNTEVLKGGALSAGWSKGTSLTTSQGDVIQPVKLLPPTSIQTPGRGDLDKMKTPMRLSLDRSISQEPGQTTLLDLVNGSTIKKPVTAFIHFSKDIRNKVVEENPKASFKDIAKLIGEAWKELDLEDKQKYEDLYTKSVKKYKEAMSKISNNNDDKQKGTNKLQKVWTTHKRRKLDEMNVSKLLQSPGSSQPFRQKKEIMKKTVEIKMNMSYLRQKYSSDLMDSQTVTCPSGLQLIGQLKSHGVWVCLRGEKLACLIPPRAKECLIFQKLMKDFICPVIALDTPVLLSHSLVGGQRCLEKLQEMKKEQDIDGFYYYTDPLLVNNGFKIRQTSEMADNIKLELVGTTQCMPSFGLCDLREVLETVSSTNITGPSDCRPVKIIHYLQGEAVRISRQLPRLTKQEVTDTWHDVIRSLPRSQSTCFHDKPFLLDLYDLDSLPESQFTQS